MSFRKYACSYLVAQSCLIFATPWSVAHQAPLSMGFSKQECWSGLCTPPGDLPNSGIKPRSPVLKVDYLPTEPPGKLISLIKLALVVAQNCKVKDLGLIFRVVKIANNHLKILGMSFTVIFWTWTLKEIKIALCTLATLYDF